ncbi:RNA methyltransferase [Streptococcus gallolyticus]|uniref:TrmH family RNA methyltransferase n=1 Tax=Streptococcus hepaticus TaxID=3349163 RepID=UPI001C95EC2B|nr:RNA methyltransferase [Streptococcus gallolyticus]MBY5040178.1 RNA methyltransferase [Streptococcus gallolyticus]
MEVIRSKANQLVKQTKKLHQKKYRKRSYLIEGWHLLEEAQKSGAQIERIFVLEDHVDRVADLTNVTAVSREILIDLADSQTPQGVVAQVSLPEQELPTALKGKFLFLEDVQDPGNVGTMIRTADAAGYDAVFISDKSADIYNLKVLRSMQGSHFHLPIYRLATEELFRLCQENGVKMLATTLSKESVDYKEVSAPANFVLVMGNEGQGISNLVAHEADQLVHISMSGQAESLNVAVAAGILLFSFI